MAVLNIENGLNPATLDYPKKTLDLKTTTINGVLKMVVEEVLFKKDSLKGITEFKGQVYRVTKTPVNSTSDSPGVLRFLKSILSSSDKSNNISICKVRIPEIHGMLPVPSTFGTTKEDEAIIDLYPDFIVEPKDGNTIEVSVGSIVNTGFGNLTTYQDGKIINVFAEIPQGQGDIKPIGADPTSSSSQNLFNSKFPSNPLTSNNLTTKVKYSKGDEVAQPNETLFGAWAKGEYLGLKRAKPISGTYAGGQFLRSEAADSWHQMRESAMANGIKLMGISGWRNHEQQAALRRERHNPDGSLTESGRRNGQAAKEGWSEHENGVAIDIDVNKSFSSKQYIWLSQNAARFNFYNTGKDFKQTAEPWHFEYIVK